MIWTIILAAVFAVILAVKNKPHGLGEKTKCPFCGSENVNIGKRGFSFAQGIGMAVALPLSRLVVAAIVWKVTEQPINTDGLYLAAGLGLLLGFIGAGNLRPGLVTETTGTVLAIGATLPAFDPERVGVPVLCHPA